MIKKLFFLLIVVSLVACDEDISDEQSFHAYVNEWIYSNMAGVYYWNDDLPPFKKNYGKPVEYYKSLLHQDDRFSAIYEDYEALMKRLTGVSPAEIGFEFKLFLESTGSEKVICIVSFTKPNTPARSTGIKRGDIINRINGTQLTLTNYQQLLAAFSDATSTVKLGFTVYSNGGYVDAGEKVLTKTSNYKEDPVFLDSVYTIGSKKVGYLVYNFFTPDAGDGSMTYDLKLNSLMGDFLQKDVSELIVDLRYNSGGMMSTAILLGSMLVPEPEATKVFSYTEYNENLTSYFNSEEYKKKYSDSPFVEYFITSVKTATSTVPVQSLGSKLKRIYFLTGKSTASASEMVINGLKPYLPCILIGEVTVGKNVGSIVIKDDDNQKNKYAFMPIVLKYFNKDRKSDFNTGFVPTMEVYDDFAHQLGDTREELLSAALSHISGGPMTVRAETFKPQSRGTELPLQPMQLLVKDVMLKKQN
jgi:C-terminal processing protease CtpA/Prc